MRTFQVDVRASARLMLFALAVVVMIPALAAAQSIAGVVRDSSGAVSVDVRRGEAEAIVRVMDSGAGFTPALVDQIFVPFVSTKPHGSGLGLAICASVVQRAGGRIDVANATDGGGIVTVRLPLRITS